MLAAFLSTCGHLAAQAPAEPEDIRPPKAFVEIPEPKKPPVTLWVASAGGAIALLGAWLLWRKWLGKRGLRTPQEIALQSLAELERSRESSAAEAFANRAAQTVREYIAMRFGLAAPRRTTEEFLRDVEKSPIIGESDHLKAFLKSCDLAKFAGANLDDGQRGELIKAARSFVNATAGPNVTRS